MASVSSIVFVHVVTSRRKENKMQFTLKTEHAQKNLNHARNTLLIPDWVSMIAHKNLQQSRAFMP